MKLALALWAIFALAVFADLVDWRTRQAGFQFITSQAARRAQGTPLDTIEHGFRPLARQATLESAGWSLLLLLGGTGATLVSARRARQAAF